LHIEHTAETEKQPRLLLAAANKPLLGTLLGARNTNTSAENGCMAAGSQEMLTQHKHGVVAVVLSAVTSGTPADNM